MSEGVTSLALPRRAVRLVLSLTLLLTGCHGATKDTEPDVAGPTVEPAVVRHRYNDRVTRIAQFWSRAVVEINYKDDEGKSRSEQGDGPLIIRKPAELALSIGKLGNTMYWLGSDAQRFWFLDLNPPNGKARTAMVGRHEDIGKPGMRSLPLPIRPDDLIQLLGIVPLPDEQPAGISPEPDVQGRKAGYWFRTPLESSMRRGERQVFVDEAGEAVVVRFADADGLTIAESRLSEYQPLKIAGKGLGGWPEMATRVAIALPASEAKVTLFLGDMTDDKQKVRDAQFNLDTLVKLLKVERVERLEPK